MDGSDSIQGQEQPKEFPVAAGSFRDAISDAIIAGNHYWSSRQSGGMEGTSCEFEVGYEREFDAV